MGLGLLFGLLARLGIDFLIFGLMCEDLTEVSLNADSVFLLESSLFAVI